MPQPHYHHDICEPVTAAIGWGAAGAAQVDTSVVHSVVIGTILYPKSLQNILDSIEIGVFPYLTEEQQVVLVSNQLRKSYLFVLTCLAA